MKPLIDLSNLEIKIADNAEQLTLLAVDLFVSIAKKTIEEKGRFTVALAGGSTPKALYERLASVNFSWINALFFFGDERNIPPDNERSNFRLANEAFLRKADVPPKNIFRWRTELGDTYSIATEYESILKKTVIQDKRSTASPRFDLILLGLGTDGHTASLFPHTKALHENEKLAVANWVPQLNEYRFTMTFPVINNATNVIFLVSGKEKSVMVKRVIEGNRDWDAFPAQLVLPSSGKLIWLLDKAAGSLLDRK
ncbi:MAG: 6-phosphogluconolactonase [Blastocatellia bacterium]